MSKNAAPLPRRPGRLQRPRVLVETRVSQCVGPKLAEWAQDLQEATPRVLGDSDPEAVHDLRVALRRIRSLLRIVRWVYGRFHTTAIRREMAKVADATGALRDEEVLAETLAALELKGAAKSGLAAWRQRRKQRLKALRSSVVSLIASGALKQPIAHMQALVSLPCNPKRDREVRRFARQVVLEAQANVDECRAAEISDVAGMHALRIAYKRLRYSIEAFAKYLPPELRAWRDVAAKFQSLLGDLHDHDVAIEVLRRAANLRSETRGPAIRALREKRESFAQQYLELVGHQGQPLVES
jgi:CHAD domain-containing protein